MKYTEEQVRQWAEMYEGGMDGSAIAAEVGVPFVSVYRRLRKFGVQICAQRASRKPDRDTKLKEHAAWHRNWRAKNKESLKTLRVNLLNYKRELRKRPCADCGKTFPPVAMDFDHLPEFEKTNTISHSGVVSVSWIDTEVAKCEVVCVLCHRDRTKSRFVYSDSKSAKSKRSLRDKIDRLKTGPCAICGLSYEPHKMDFDHIVRCEKTDKISNMIRRRASYASILAEINKCRLLCAVCHRVHTDNQLHGR